MSVNVYVLKTPLRPGVAYSFPAVVFRRDVPYLIKKTVSLATGDVTLHKDNGAGANLAALPVETGSSGLLWVTLSTAETTGVNGFATVIFSDQADNEWADTVYIIPAVDSVSLPEAGDGPGEILDAQTADHLTAGTVGAAIARIGSNYVIVRSPVAENLDLEIYQGDDYLAADGRALDWTDQAGTWPDLTGASVSLIISTVGTFAGSVPVPTGTGKTVRVELTNAVTAALNVTTQDYQVVVTLASGSVVTLGAGAATITGRVAV